MNNPRKHILYKDGDKDIPDCVTDRNGQVCLHLCRACGKGEAELYDNPVCEPSSIWYAADGTMMDKHGNRSIFDDVDQ